MAVALFAMFGLVACGTFLAAHQETNDPTQPKGVVLNQRAAYTVSVKPLGAFDQFLGGRTEAADGLLVGVDNQRTMSLNVARMPFSSGKLVVKVNKQQVPQEVSLTSQTGAVRAVDAARSGVDAQATIAVPSTATPAPTATPAA